MDYIIVDCDVSTKYVRYIVDCDVSTKYVRYVCIFNSDERMAVSKKSLQNY